MLYTIIRKNDLEDVQLSGNDGVVENHKNTKNSYSVALRVGCSVVALFVVTAACTMLFMGGNHLTSSEVKLSSTCKTAFDCDFAGRPRKIQTKGGLVVADHGVCSEIGAQALDDGGHAVDAAVATAICQGVINSFASGLGGGDFLMIREANGSSLFINAREQAASAATADMYAGKDSYAALDGGLAVAIPLQLKGLELAWSRYGKLPWSSLVVPSIKLAEDGFRMHPYLHYILSGPFTLRRIQNNTLLREVYLIHETDGSWRIPNVGEWCCRKPTLARSLRRISKLGAAWLYSPRQSKLMAAEIQSAGGILTETDLRSSFPTVHRPMSKKIGDFEFIFPPPPSSGAAVVLAMDILAGFPNTTNRMLTQHWLVESMKHIYAVRTSMGDPGTPEHPFRNMSELLSDMMDAEFSERLRESIHDDRVLDASEYGGQWNPECLGSSLDVKEDHGTSHMSIVDAEGNAVSMTMTINTAFGSAVVSESTGIIFNNEMDDFNTKGPTGSHLLPAGLSTTSVADRSQLSSKKPCLSYPDANFIAPWKRPLSSMSPMFVLKGGQLHVVIGASGGLHIVSAVLQILQRILVHGEDPLLALTQPRIEHHFSPDNLFYENYMFKTMSFNVSGGLQKYLEDKGNILKSNADQLGSCQVILIDTDTGLRTGVSDPRKDGAPATTT